VIRSKCDEGVFRDADIMFQYLCHRDLAPRNIVWQDDGSVYLLDWLTGGFYPVSFEICSQRNGISEDYHFN
jgi:thiamine kinase-like enzyme